MVNAKKRSIGYYMQFLKLKWIQGYFFIKWNVVGFIIFYTSPFFRCQINILLQIKFPLNYIEM